MKIAFNYFKFAIFACCSILASCGTGGSSPSSSPIPTTQYTSFNCPDTVNVSFPGISGIRGVTNSSTNVYITGVYVQYGANHAFLYKGPILGGGTCMPFNYPSSPGKTVTATSLYGPDNNGNGKVIVVGSYTTVETGPIAQLGLLYQGAEDGSSIDGWTTLNPSSLTSETIINTLGHSTMGGLVVGNFDTNLSTGRAFIYNINAESYTEFKIPGSSASVTLYGIWYNGGTNYTLTGGYSAVMESGVDLGFLADWDSSTQRVTNFVSLNYKDLPPSQVGTHFEGITTDGAGGYNLSGDWQNLGSTPNPVFVHVPRNSDGSYGTATWTDFSYPNSSVTSANTVYQNYVLGLYQLGGTLNYGYVATIAN